MNNLNLLIFLFVIVIFSNCTYDTYVDNIDIDECDTLEVSYATDVVPLLDENCFSCHFDEEDNNGLWLATYEIVSNKNTTTNILQRIQLDATDLASMPPSGPLNDCEIDIFKAWVEQGAQNN